jgi:hypothetical protein
MNSEIEEQTTNSTDLFYYVFLKGRIDRENPPLVEKFVQGGGSYPETRSLVSYIYLLGEKDVTMMDYARTFIYKNLIESEVTFLALSIDVVGVYTVSYNDIDKHIYAFSVGKFCNAMKIFEGLKSKQCQNRIKKDPLWEIVYLGDVQKELYRAKHYMLKSAFDTDFLRLIDAAIIKPNLMGNGELKGWYMAKLDSLYKLRFN